MGDKVKAAGELSQSDEQPPKSHSLSMIPPKVVRPLPGLQTDATPLQVPFGLQYLGSSPRKHIKGNGTSNNLTISGRGSPSVLATVGGKINSAPPAVPQPPIPSSATAAATLLSQSDNNNDKCNAIVRITRNEASPEPTTKPARTMANFHLLSQPFSVEPQEQGLPSFHSFMGRASPSPAHWTPDISTSTRTLPIPGPLSLYDLGRLQNEIHFLRSNSSIQQQEMKVCAAHVADLAVFNENIHKYLSSLNGRLQVLEVDNARYREAFGELETHVHSRSSAGLRVKLSTTYADNSGLIATTQTPKPKESFVYMASDDDDAFDAAAGEVESQVEQTTVEGLPTPANTSGPPTATTSSFNFNNLPPAMNPSQPKTTAVTGVKKPTTMLAKRSGHNLSKTMAPATTQLPQMPLTNVEVIAYFFNSVSRPIVALRLYAQNEGPASITTILNEHRSPKPPYLRNTCSVKCVTAIRRGKEQYGSRWESKYRALFEEAINMDDTVMGLSKATELIRIPEEEIEEATDIDVLQLLNGLSQHPQENEGRGLFTVCVEYCEDNRLRWPLSKIHMLAAELQAGHRPQAYRENWDDDMEVDSEPNDVRSGKREALVYQIMGMERSSIIEVSDTDADTVIDDGLHAGYSPGGKENGQPDEVEEDDEVLNEDI